MGPEILTDGGIRALSKMENSPIKNYVKTTEIQRSVEAGQNLWLVNAPPGRDSFREDKDFSQNSVSKISNYDTVAMPCGDQSRKNPFKAKPSSISYVIGSSATHNSSTFDTSTDKSRAQAKSNVLLRAARSITKTKSISGSFIVKTTIRKGSAHQGNKASDDSSDTTT